MRRALLALLTALWTIPALSQQTENPKFTIGSNIEILVNMFRDLNMFYVNDVDADKLLVDMASGMTRSLDPYTQYLPKEDMKQFELLTTGRYAGVGSLIRKDGDWVVFAEPYKGSPADRAGIGVGDRILEIDGKDARGFTTEQVSTALKGESGTSVRVKVRKFFTGEEKPLRLTREFITISGVEYCGMLRDSVGIIRHGDFTEDCSRDMLRSIMSLKEQGAKAIILDYRGNGGGILQEAVKILSLFLPKGTEVVSTKGKLERLNSVFVTENEPVDTAIPLAVLVNGSSASATEILSGALQDMDRAVIIGQRTYGKGLVQSTRPLGYDTFLKLTTAHYYLPSGRCIQALDYARRNDDGSISAVPDSLITEFSTLGGRKVYDGGGIMPDVITEPEYVSRYAYLLNSYNLISQFVDGYLLSHDGQNMKVKVGEYRFPEQDYDEFIEFISDKTVAWESETSYLMRQLREKASQEEYMSSLSDQIAALEERIASISEAELYKDDIITMIEDEIMLRYCYADGVIANSYLTDQEVDRAISLLLDPAEYGRILSEQDTARK